MGGIVGIVGMCSSRQLLTDFSINQRLESYEPICRKGCQRGYYDVVTSKSPKRETTKWNIRNGVFVKMSHLFPLRAIEVLAQLLLPSKKATHFFPGSSYFKTACAKQRQRNATSQEVLKVLFKEKLQQALKFRTIFRRIHVHVGSYSYNCFIERFTY